MRKYFVILAALVAAAAVSCTKNELTGPETGIKNYRVFAAEFGDQTKTALNDATGAVSWAEGDAIKIFWNASDVQQNVVSEALTAEGAAETPVKFMAEAEPEGNTYAVYPSSVAPVINGFLEIPIPAVQTGVFADANILVAKWVDGKFVFRNVCGFLQFSVPEGVTKVVWTGDCVTPLAGSIKVGFPSNISLNGLASGSESNEITVNVSGAGTYYAAVAPGKYESLYVAMYNGDELVGEKQTFNAVEVARCQVKKMGAMPTTLLTDGYFASPAGAGSKDGSSWDNAADVAALRAALASANADGKKFYLAAGTYNWTADLSLGVAGTFAIYGGYPADATGKSLSGRNPETNKTILDAGGTKRIFVVTKPSVTFDGLTLQNAKRTGTADAGSALILQGAGNTTINNCVFRNNVNESGRGGAMRIAMGETVVIKITNSVFEYNQATGAATTGTVGDGGAIVMTGGILISRNNTYFKNVSTYAATEGGGGAIQIEPASGKTLTAEFDGDLFDRNTALKSTGSAVYASGSGTYVIKFNNCAFMHNRASSRGCVRSKNTAAANKLMFNACSFAADTVAQYGSAIHSQSYTAIHNCAFYSNINTSATGASNIYFSANTLISNTSIRLGGNSSVGIREVGGVGSIVVNNIVTNTLSGADLDIASGKSITSYGHNLFGTSGTDAVNAVGTYTVEDPVNHADYCYLYNKDTQPWRILPDWYGAPNYVLKWTEWPAPGKPEDYELCTPARVEAAIDQFDVNTSMGVKAWLNELGALNTDRRGTARSTTAIWPGSYDNSATASL